MTKFLSPENFFKCEDLMLFPFSFERKENGQYLIGNIVGELDEYSCEDLIRLQSLDFDEPDALYLRASKQMLLGRKNEQYGLQILAARMRSRMSFITHGPALHLFVVTLRCEHSCPYCQVSRSSQNTVGRDMSEGTADLSIDLAFSSPENHIKIEFQGGEPLLNFKLIRYIVQKSKKKAYELNKSVDFVITTNLALLDDKIIEFCRVHKIFISTSLDGRAPLHNANRPRQGNNSYELAVAGIKRIQTALGPERISALMTTTHRSLEYVKDIIDQYVELGLSRVFLRPLSPHGFAIKTKYISKYNDVDYIEFWKRGLAYILELNKKGIFIQETYACILLKKLLTDDPVSYVDLRSPTGGGLAALVYNYDGKIYASDESRMLAEVGDEAFVLGIVGQTSFKDLLIQDKLISVVRESATQGAPQCESCVFEPHCGADPVYHYTTQRDIVGIKSLSGFCYRQKATITHLQDILNNYPEEAKILKGWIL